MPPLTPGLVTLPAYAKINLDLRILGVRPDGYHDLRTVFQSVALADRVTVRRRRGPFVLTCGAPGVPTDRRNLAWKAASLLWRSAGLGTGEPRNLEIDLEKRIPVEAGLGGGSADAAATLLALNQLWALALDMASLSRLAGRLGADVPFGLVGGTALGLGRGDDIYPLADPPRVDVVVIRPGFGVATADAYRWFDQEPRRSKAQTGRTVPPGWPSWAESLANDLEPAVTRHHPTIAAIRRSLLDAGAATAAMSGSGSAVFGLFERADAARRTAQDLARPGWTVVCTRTLSRREFERHLRRALAGSLAPRRAQTIG
jgi:4-diphosphocytidyl-2-C-methyl-D-erythritol kinase